MANYNPSGESEAVVVRPSATSLFAFDSDDRYADYIQRRISPSYPFRVLIQKSEALLTGFFKRIGLTEFRLNWTLPNISRGWGTNIINFVWTGAATVTATSGTGTIQTYTCQNLFQPGQTVTVTCTTAGYNLTNATILTATTTQFTVAGTFTGATGTGVALVGSTATVTAATASTGINGITSITFTANNNYVAGQLLYSVTGLTPAGFNVSNLRITSATSTQFVVALPVGTTLSGSSTGTGTALMGLSRQINFGEGFLDTWNAAEYLQSSVASILPGFQAFVIDPNEPVIRCLPPIDPGFGAYEFYFDPVTAPVQYGRGPVTAATGSGTAVTYTCANSFSVGQSVTVTGLNITTGASLNLTGIITSASSTQFVIANTTVGTSVATQAGLATADGSAINPNVSVKSRQLIDMLGFPYAKQYYSITNNSLIGSVPNMRATDYIDIVCSQLTVNQSLRDSNTLPITRDAMTRIYLDENTPSLTNFQTRTNGLGSPTTLTLTGVVSQTANVVVFSVSTSPPTTTLDCTFTTSNITGGSGWNGTGTVVALDTASPFNIAVAYDDTPSGVPVFSASSAITVFTNTPSITRPLTSWDSRMNGVTPFCMYRQFANPKQIRWSGRQPIGNVVFELYDDQGRSIQNLWEGAFPISTSGVIGALGVGYANGFTWNANCLLSED